MGAACFQGPSSGRAGRHRLTARGLCHLSPASRAQQGRGTPRGRLATRVPSCTVVRAALRCRGLVPGGLAQAAGCVVMGPQGAGHLVFGCPRWAGTQLGLGRPSRWQ